MVEWHPRRLVRPVEWVLTVPGHPEPVAVIRRLKLAGRVTFRAVTWAPKSGGRELIDLQDGRQGLQVRRRIDVCRTLDVRDR